MKKIITAVLLFLSANASSQSNSNQYRKDFDLFWDTVNDNYCYFNKKPIDWLKIKNIYAVQADTVTSKRSFTMLMERAINELYDHHCSLNTNTPFSRRLVPSGADIWAAFVNGKAVIQEVRMASGADKAGVKAGMEVIAVNDIPIIQAISSYSPHTKDAEALNFALRLLLAGNHVTARKISVKNNGGVLDFYPDKDGMLLDHIQYKAKVESAIYGTIGYIKINNFLFDNDIIAQFDSVLNTMLNKKAIILDFRETPSGGNTTVARAILGRFITHAQFYQKHELYAEEKETGVKRSWAEIVSPRGKPYLKPVVVLANHWTGSVGEGIVIAFEGMKRATVIGTELARLNGAINSVNMPNTHIGFSIPTERLYHVNGVPRELYKPTIMVDVTKPYHGDLILDTALSFLKK